MVTAASARPARQRIPDLPLDDPRLDVLLGDTDLLRQPMTAAAALDDPVLAAQAELALPTLRRWLDTQQHLTLEQAGRELLAASYRRAWPADRLAHLWVDALTLRFGLTTGHPVALADVASTLGVTRNRVRVVEAAVLRARATGAVPMPALDAALTLLTTQTRPRPPAPADQTGVAQPSPGTPPTTLPALVDAGLAEQPLSVATLRALCWLTGRARQAANLRPIVEHELHV